MMKLNIQMFGGRGASSTSSSIIKIKNDTFTTAIATYNENGDRQREDVKVKGVSFKYKNIGIGVFNATQESYPNAQRPGRGGDKYVSVVRTNNKANGVMLTTGKTQKEAVSKSMELIDTRKQDILRAIGK